MKNKIKGLKYTFLFKSEDLMILKIEFCYFNNEIKNQTDATWMNISQSNTAKQKTIVLVKLGVEFKQLGLWNQTGLPSMC